MSDFVQNRLPSEYELDDEWGVMPDESLSAPALYHEIESEILGDTREMLESIASAVEAVTLPEEGLLQLATHTIAELDALTPSDADDSSEAFRADPESAFNRTPAILVRLLDQLTEAWGYGDRAPFQANETQRLRYLIIVKMLGHFEERFGLAPISATVGKDVDTEAMNVVEQLPAERDGEVPGKIARLVHVGFRLNDGALWRQADVAQFISRQEDATRYALEHYRGLLIR